MLAVIFGLCLLAQDVGVNAQERLERDVLKWQMNHAGGSPADQKAANREAVYEEQQFANKFNHLVATLREFAEQYNHHVVDLKKVKALKKAWRDLEKTDGWLRLDEASGH